MNIHQAIEAVEANETIVYTRGILKGYMYKLNGVYYASAKSGFITSPEISIALGALLYGKPQRVNVATVKQEFDILTERQE